MVKKRRRYSAAKILSLGFISTFTDVSATETRLVQIIPDWPSNQISLWKTIHWCEKEPGESPNLMKALTRWVLCSCRAVSRIAEMRASHRFTGAAS